MIMKQLAGLLAGAEKGGQPQLTLLDLLLINAAGDTDDLMGALYPNSRTAAAAAAAFAKATTDVEKVAALAVGRRGYGCSAVVRNTDAAGLVFG